MRFLLATDPPRSRQAHVTRFSQVDGSAADSHSHVFPLTSSHDTCTLVVGLVVLRTAASTCGSSRGRLNVIIPTPTPGGSFGGRRPLTHLGLCRLTDRFEHRVWRNRLSDNGLLVE